MSHSSPLVRSVFVESAQTCNSNFIGYNFLFGNRHCKTYSTEDVALGRLIREFRNTQVSNFSTSELDTIVCSTSLIFCFTYTCFHCTSVGMFAKI